jgi:hypothetical protein
VVRRASEKARRGESGSGCRRLVPAVSRRTPQRLGCSSGRLRVRAAVWLTGVIRVALPSRAPSRLVRPACATRLTAAALCYDILRSGL